MNPQPLSFTVLLGFLQRAIAQAKDPRQASNASHYSLSDVLLGHFQSFSCSVSRF